jgi:D-xylose 1-dehydrogenase (NADP+, D-xylono-1,5-lactone-forming)
VAPVRWAMLGAGWIAHRALTSAFRDARNANLDVIAARDRDRAQQLMPLRYASNNYQDVVEDPEVDAIYIALDNGSHAEWIEAGLACGKTVVCEKPLTPTGHSTTRLIALAEDCGGTLIEALWNLWHPRTQRAMNLVRDGLIGEVTGVTGTFTFLGVPENNYRLNAARGGGALLDVGCYPLTAAAWATQGASMELKSAVIETAGSPVDMTSEATFESSGSNIRVRASFMEPENQSLVIEGSEGTLVWSGEDAFTSYQQPSSLKIIGSTSTYEEHFPPVDSYRIMIEQISQKIQGDEAWIPPSRWSQVVSEAIDQALTSAR